MAMSSLVQLSEIVPFVHVLFASCLEILLVGDRPTLFGNDGLF